MATRAAGTAKIIMSRIWSSLIPNRFPHREHRMTARIRPDTMMMPYQ